MRLRAAAVGVALVALLTAATGGRAASAAAAGRARPPRCSEPPVVGARRLPQAVRAWAHGAPVFGSGSLWGARFPLDNGPVALVDGTYEIPKLPWYVVPPGGKPSITGRRRDGQGTFTADANVAVDRGGSFAVSSLQFSTAGCWQVTARYHDTVLRFTVDVPAVQQNRAQVIVIDTQNNPVMLAATVGRLRHLGYQITSIRSGPIPGPPFLNRSRQPITIVSCRDGFPEVTAANLAYAVTDADAIYSDTALEAFLQANGVDCVVGIAGAGNGTSPPTTAAAAMGAEVRGRPGARRPASIPAAVWRQAMVRLCRFLPGVSRGVRPRGRRLPPRSAGRGAARPRRR